MSDEPDESGKKELLERWERHPGDDGVLEVKFLDEGVIYLMKCCNKAQKKGKSLLDWPLGMPGDLCMCSPGTGSKDHRSYCCYPGCACTCMRAY